MNKIIATLPHSAPGVNPSAVVTTGATEIRLTFPEDQVPGVLVAYMAGIKMAFAIGIAANGIAFIISFLGGWKRLHKGTLKGGA